MTSRTEASRAGSSAGRRQLDGDLLVGERALGAGDALADGGFGGEERPRDLGGGQAAEQAEGEREPPLDREFRVAGGEDQA
ncbi:hypothetical protein GCM10020220_061450 [Nonomuraea rubra]